MQVTKEAETKPGFCQCGRPLHYSNRSVFEQVQRIVELSEGPFVTVKILGVGSYRVQRHFIALHGINAKTLEEYGFEKVLEPERKTDVGS